MSKRVEEIIEVIEEVRERVQKQPGLRSISPVRVEAVRSVARRRGIAYHTVNDKFRRQLEPNIEGVAEFDKLLEDSLRSGSVELRDILLTHRVDEGDVTLINHCFYDAVGREDIMLAEEFGYEADDRAFIEGKSRLRLHLRKERSPRLVDSAKKRWMQQQSGDPLCLVCSFSFWQVYGDVGEGFVEAHHTVPISSLDADTPASVDDLVPVCSNCHSMLHRQRPWLTVQELRGIVSQNSK